MRDRDAADRIEWRDRRFRLGDALFAQAIEDLSRELNRPILVGLSGMQGSGKSTTAARLEADLRRRGHTVAICSIDDFYLTRAARAALACDVHPLLATRGVPGTHDLELMRQTIFTLLEIGRTRDVLLPAFNKASDERCPSNEWRSFEGGADIVLLEGWCVGARPQNEQAIAMPVNALERNEDRGGTWRRYVNHRLSTDYASFFECLDLKLMLRAPSFECVYAWRAEQEENLEIAEGSRHLATGEELARFIAHYERCSRWMLTDEPADLIADLDTGRAPIGWRCSAEFSRALHTDRRA